MVSQARAQRVAERIKEELSEIVLFDISDPRLQDLFVTYVRVDRELAYANVFVSALGGSEVQAEVMEGLEHAKGFLRSQLARRIDLRTSFEKQPHHLGSAVVRCVVKGGASHHCARAAFVNVCTAVEQLLQGCHVSIGCRLVQRCGAADQHEQ